MEPFKIKSPKTGRLIDAYGTAYNNLLKEGYKDSQLLSHKIPVVKSPKSVKVLNKQKEYLKYIESIMLPDEIIFEEIIMKMDSPDFISICRLNKKFNKLCDNEHFWQKMYNKHYNDSEMKALLPDISYKELFEICYNLHFIQITFTDGISLKKLYQSTIINIHGGANRKFLTALSYMNNLISINFYIKDLSKPIIIPHSVNQLPFLTEINYKKV